MARLEKLKFKNFKSFRSARLPIAEGYTTIVGPNGSGKSNLLDGIAFVLGSNSMKSLRADKLVDLVHSSAKEGMAEVELHVRDGDTVHQISRKIDKKGNSVFRLNKRRTTRTQLTDFLGTMNLRPDGHNIIMQGDVANIIEMTPMQRRTVVDEVSGIAEYEQKKLESMRELQKVEKRTDEADIVLQERKGYLDTLREEKKEAERCLILQKQLKEYNASLVKKELDKAEKTFSKDLELIEKDKERIKEYEGKREKSLAELDGVEKKCEAINNKIFKESDARQKGVRDEIEVIRSEMAVIEEKIRTAKEVTDKSGNRRQELAQQVSAIGNEVKSREDEIETSFLQKEELAKAIQVKQAELDGITAQATKFDKNIEKKYTSLTTLNDEIEQKKEELHKMEMDIQSITERLNLKKAAYDSKSTEVSAFQKKEKQIIERIEELEDKVKLLKDDISKRDLKIEAGVAEENACEQKIGKIDEYLNDANARISELDAKVVVMKHISGKSKAVEAVIKNLELSGIVGTISDLCTFDPKYTAAIQTAAGPKMFYIVTKTADDATTALKYLKRNKLGKATFLPLDTVRVPSAPAELAKAKTHKATLDTAITLLNYDKKHEKAFQTIFGSTLIVENIDAAREIGIGKIRMATLDGDLCEETGIITGGFTKEGVSLDDIRNLERLRKKVPQLKKEREDAVKALENERAKTVELREGKTTVGLESKEAEVMLKQWLQRIKEYRDTAKQTEIDSGGVQKEIQGMGDAVKEKEKEKSALEKEVTTLIGKRQKIKVVFERPEVKDLSEKIQTLQVEIQTLRDQEIELKVQANSTRGEIEKGLLLNRKNLKEQIAAIDAENKEMDTKITELDKKRAELTKTLKTKEVKARKLASSMTDLFKEKDEFEDQRRLVDQRVVRYEHQMQKLKDEINEHKIEKARLEGRYNDLKRQWEKYKNQEIEIINKDAIELKYGIEETQKKLEDMGTVNMKALEVYEKYKKEVEDIQEKCGKLGEEKQGILNVIEEIEKKKITSFMETFNALHEYFNQYYKEFYTETETEAGLKLQNAEQPLEGGLIIEAKPAGKRIKTIDSMSGGEKVIAALAFLFAIQSYKPSPFYVLDEVDAALDKENSERLVRMLKKFSKSLQFVIVTHNLLVTKGSDQIVGVHLAKDGSSIVEVDLKNYGTMQLAQER